MAYNTRFFFRFESDAGREFRINIKQDGFSGTAVQRPLGSSPTLRRDDAENGIRGTSLEIIAECNTDNEFAALYTSDARKFYVELIDVASNIVLWDGFVSPELYAAPEIAPPYDVQITAVDGLGELKRQKFQAAGRQTILSHLQTILGYSGLSTGNADIVIIDSLHCTTPSVSAANLLGSVSVDLDHFVEEDFNCYDALESILRTLNLTITRISGKRWLLMRESDVEVESDAVAARTAGGTSVSLAVPQYGSMTAFQWWPVGNMANEIEPARKQLSTALAYAMQNSMLNDSEMQSASAWTTQNVSIEYGYAKMQGDSINHTPAILSQGISVAQYNAPLQLAIAAMHEVNVILSQDTDAKATVEIKLESSGTTMYLQQSSGDLLEWTTRERDFKMTVPLTLTGSGTTEFEWSIPNIPAAGTLTITITVPYSSGHANHVWIDHIHLLQTTPYGYKDTVVLDNDARGESDETVLVFGDAPYSANALLNLRNVAAAGGVIVEEWATAQFEGALLSVMALDRALAVALPRLWAKGTINVPTDAVLPFVIVSPDELPMIVRRASWNLLEDEIDVDLLSIPSAEVEIDSETTTEMSQGEAAAAGGSAGGSGSSGGSSSGGSSSRSIYQYFEDVEDSDGERVGIKSLYDLFITQTEADESATPPVAEEIKNISEILRHLRLETVTDALNNESTVLVTDITFASEKNTVAGWIGSGGGGGTVTGSLATLADVTLGTLSAGDILRYDALTSHWVNTPLALSLGDLTNVELGTPSNGQALVYDSTAGKWKPGNVSGGGVTVVSSDATIGTSLTTIGTIDGTAIKAKIAAYLEISQFTASNIVTALGTTAVNRAKGDESGNVIKNYYCAGMNIASDGHGGKLLRIINANGTTLNYVEGSDLLQVLGFATTDTLATQSWVSGLGYITSSALSGYMELSQFTASNIVDVLGTTAVNRATADASGNTIASQTWVGQQGFLTSSSLSGYMQTADYTGTGTSVVNRAKCDESGNNIKATYAAGMSVKNDTAHNTKILCLNDKAAGTTLAYVEGSDIVNVIGNVAVARATADASGNAFATSYLRKDTDDTMSANLTIGASNGNKWLMVYGTATITSTLDVGGNTAIGGQTSTSAAKTLTLYGRNNSTNPALIIKGVSAANTSYSTTIYRDANALQIVGDVFVTGNFKSSGYSNAGASASDRRLKNDIRSITLTEAADLLSVLNPVVFQWNQDAELLSEGGLKGVSRGFIADEFLDLLPNAGRKMWGKYDAICYEQVIPYLVAGWQQQNLRIRILEGEISTLREDNELLRRRLREANVLQ